MKSNSRLLLLGYSGKRNFGDDLLLKQAYDAFHEIAEVHIHTSTLHEGSNYLYSWFPKANISKSVQLKYKYLKNFTHILQFGGGVFFNYRKDISFKYYWRKRLSMIKNYNWVKQGGTHFSGIGIGLGPFIHKKSEELCLRRLQFFDYLNVRDQFSLKACKSLKNKVTVCEDLSLASYQYFQSFKICAGLRAKKVIICPRKFPHGENKDKYLKNLFAICDNLKAEGKEVLIYAFQSHHDEIIIEEFSKRGFKTQIWNPDEMSIENVLEEFASCEFIITARMHGLYISGMLDVPVIGIGVHQKLKLASKFFSKSLYLPDTFEVSEMNECIQKLNKLPENNFNLLHKKENECKEQYELIKNWIRGNTIYA